MGRQAKGEGDYAPVFGPDECESCFFKRFAMDTVFGGFPFFELASDTYPLIFVDVIFFLDTMEEQIFAVLLDIAEGCVNHTLQI